MSEQRLGRVMVLGSRGMVGSAMIRKLERTSGVSETIPVCRAQIDLTSQSDTFAFLASQRPDWIVVAAAKVGGIYANSTYPKDFIYENVSIELNVIEGAYRAGIEKLIFLGSSCIYPKFAEQPIREESLLSGLLESTNEPYAIAKIAGIKLCESYNRQYQTDYRSLMPTNLYGPGDNYHAVNSHVIPALIRRFHEAKVNKQETVDVWGSGRALRDFLFVDDLANAVVHVMGLSKGEVASVSGERCSHLNVGSGSEITIFALSKRIASAVGFEGVVKFDKTKPDGTPRKLLDTSRLCMLGWHASTPLDEGLGVTYEHFEQEFHR